MVVLNRARDVVARACRVAGRALRGRGQSQDKAVNELAYWRERKRIEGDLRNDHYVEFYTSHFGLEPGFYRGKRILDVGCGPRGSLEWADMAAERVGLDPLAAEYRTLGMAAHKMTYSPAASEAIPFPSGHFDVVSAFNSLDHVDDARVTAREIIRGLKPRGFFLLLTELNHHATVCEPQEFSWDVVRMFAPPLDVVEERHYEMSVPGIYQSIVANVRYDHTDRRHRGGILSAKFRKPVGARSEVGSF